MFHNYDTPQSKYAIRGSFTIDSVSELDVLRSLALVVAENKNEMNNISQLPLFIYPGDSEFIFKETQVLKKKDKNYWVFVFPF